MHACERCYSRKTKCDRHLPQCSSCTKSGSVCRYPNKRRDRQLQQEYLRSVELQLKVLEEENKRLRGVSLRAHAIEPYGIGQSQMSISDSPPAAEESHSNEPLNETQRSPERSTGSLQRTPGEESRYLGSSNGVEFVDVVERVVDSSHTAGGLFGRVTDSHHVPKKMALPSVPQPVGLVDQLAAMPLIESYFNHWHLTFPLLYRPAFMNLVQEMYFDPRIYQENPAYAFAIDIVLALGSVSSKGPESGPVNSESHFVRALTHLDRVSNFRDIRSLQALLLYCKYGIHASLRDTSTEMWELLGKANRLCVEIGLHQNNSTVLSRCKVHITGEIPGSVQLEMQRRCFWCYYNLERIVNISLGRPLALHDDDIHIELPSALDDDALENPPASTTELSQRLSPFLHHVQLRKIQSKIHRSMYTSRSVQALSLRERQTLRTEIFNELQAWRRDISLLPLPPPEKVRDISSSYLHPSWYQALYHSGCLLLFRPSATFPAVEALESNEEIDDVLRMIWQSSRLVLARYFELLRARHLNYSWVCLYTIFMAGLANIYSVGCCVQRRKKGIQAFLPSFWDVISDVRDCSNILTAICERWDDARSSCDIFNQLSMSALKGLAATTFQRKDDSTISARTSDNLTAPCFNATIGESGQEREFSTISTPFPLQPSSPSAFPDTQTTMSLDQFTDPTLPDIDPIINFQQMFQDMQNAISTRGGVQTDEVMLGFSQEWFGR